MKKPKSKDAGFADSLRGLGARFALMFFVIVTLAMLVLGKTDPRIIERSRSVVIDFFSPLLEAFSRPVAAFNDALEWGENVAFVFQENKRLRAENQRLQADSDLAQSLTEENARFRALLNVQPDEAKSVLTARIIADTGGTFVRSMVINAGRSDGVTNGLPVLDDVGVIGRVVSVGLNSSRVLLLTDLNSRVPVKIGTTGYNAILAGDNKPQPRIIFLPTGSEVSPGDLVTTSGHGGIFPPDLAIGQVSSITSDGKIRVTLKARMDRLNFVRLFYYKNFSEPVAPAQTDEKQ